MRRVWKNVNPFTLSTHNNCAEQLPCAYKGMSMAVFMEKGYVWEANASDAGLQARTSRSVTLISFGLFVSCPGFILY
jgi:hypothetical protein